jgi:hypothetical protein
VGPAPLEEVVDGGPQVPVQPPHLRVAEGARGPGGVESGAVEDLVGDEVAHPGEAGLVHQAGLQRRRAAGQGGAQLGRAHSSGIHPEGGLVGVERHPTQPPWVPDPELAALGEPEHQAVPRRHVPHAGVLELVHPRHPVHEQATRHPEAQPDGGAIGVEQQELADATGLGQAVTLERRGQHVGRQPALEVPRVRRADPGHSPTDDPLGQPAVGLDLRELGQG